MIDYYLSQAPAASSGSCFSFKSIASVSDGDYRCFEEKLYEPDMMAGYEDCATERSTCGSHR